MPSDWLKIGAHASVVPTPPVSATEPTISPALGFRPKPAAIPMPSRFCNTMKMLASASRMAKGLPPRRKEAKSDFRPSAAKKYSSR